MTDYMPMPARYMTLLIIQELPGLTLKGLCEVFNVDPVEMKSELNYLEREALVACVPDAVFIRSAGVKLLNEYRQADQIPTITHYLKMTLIRAFNAENERDSYKSDYHMTRKQALQAKTALNMIKTYIQRAEILEQDNDDE